MKQFKVKRGLLFAFPLALLITFMIGIVSFAAGNLSLDKSSYLSQEPMNIKITGLTDAQIQDQGAWIGIFKATSVKADNYLDYKYASDEAFDSGAWTANAPNVLGDYEVRLYAKVKDVDTLLEKVSFKVESRKAKDGDVVLSKDFLKVNETATITVKGLADSQIADGAWIGIYKAGFTNDKYIDYKYVSDLNPDPATKAPAWEFHAPSDFGKYELRVFTKGGDSTDAALQTVLYDTKYFTVGATQAATGDVTLSKNKYLVGSLATVAIKPGALTQEQIDDGAWFGIYNATDMINAASITPTVWVSDISNKNFTTDIEVPEKLGDYELRVFSKNVSGSNAEPYTAAKFAVVPFSVVSNKSNDKNDIKIKNNVMKDSQKFSMKETINVVIKTYNTQAESEAAIESGKSGGVSPGQVNKGAWAGLFRLGDNNTASPLLTVYLSDNSTIRKTTSDGSKIWEFTAPEEPGEYIVKVFTQNTDLAARDTVFYGQVPLTVVNATKENIGQGAFNWTDYTLSVAPTPINVKAGRTITLNVTAKPKKGSNATPAEVNNLVLYSTKDKSIAYVTIDASGKCVVHGVKKGKSTKLILKVKGTWRLSSTVQINVK